MWRLNRPAGWFLNEGVEPILPPPTQPRFHRSYVVAVLRDGEIERWRTYRTLRLALFHARRHVGRRPVWIERGTLGWAAWHG